MLPVRLHILSCLPVCWLSLGRSFPVVGSREEEEDDDDDEAERWDTAHGIRLIGHNAAHNYYSVGAPLHANELTWLGAQPSRKSIKGNATSLCGIVPARMT